VTGPAADPITWSACCLLVALHDHARRRRRTMNRSKPLRYVSNTPGSHRRRAPRARARAGRCWREVGGRVRSSPAAPCCVPAQARARCMHTGLVDRVLERWRRIRRGARHQTSLAWTGRIVENGIQKRHTNRPCWTRSPGTGTPASWDASKARYHYPNSTDPRPKFSSAGAACCARSWLRINSTPAVLDRFVNWN